MTLRYAAIVLALLLPACINKPKEPPPRAFVGTKWVVQLELPVAGEAPWLRFGDGRMEGFGGCNRVTARYVQDAVGARALVVGRIDRGMKYCERGTQEAEARVLEVLQAVSSYHITGDTMVMSGSGGTLRFRADPPSPAE
jgi:heat shock protein HslJ